MLKSAPCSEVKLSLYFFLIKKNKTNQTDIPPLDFVLNNFKSELRLAGLVLSWNIICIYHIPAHYA